MQRDRHSSKFPAPRWLCNIEHAINFYKPQLSREEWVDIGIKSHSRQVIWHSSWLTVGAQRVLIRVNNCVHARCEVKPFAGF